MRSLWCALLCALFAQACGGNSTVSPADATGGSASSDMACAVGDTRECIGPGACKGGQECAASGWQQCECAAAGEPRAGAGGSSATSSGGAAGSTLHGGGAAGHAGGASPAGAGGSTAGEAGAGGSMGTEVACPEGFSSCSAAADCSTPVTADPQNCGACGRVCGSGECVKGVCSTRVFATSEFFKAAMGGPKGADANCQRLADKAALGGKFAAWVTDGSTTAKARILTHDAGPYRRLDGAIVAQTWGDLEKQSLLVGIAVDEGKHALAQPAGDAWTGMSSAGVASGLDCHAWTSSSLDEKAIIGSVVENFHWLDVGQMACGSEEMARLFCFELVP